MVILTDNLTLLQMQIIKKVYDIFISIAPFRVKTVYCVTRDMMNFQRIAAAYLMQAHPRLACNYYSKVIAFYMNDGAL